MQRVLLMFACSLMLGQISPLPVQAQRSSEALRNLFFTMPPDRDPGMPSTDGTSAGSRSDCDGDVGLAYTQMTALIPQEETENVIPDLDIAVLGPSYAWGQTTLSHPTLWFQVIEAPAATTFELRIEDLNGRPLYETGEISIPEKTGTFAVAMPDTAIGMMADTSYYWKATLRLACSATDADTLWVDGVVQRVMPSDELRGALETATPEEAIALYAQEGLWFDALNGLAYLYVEHPNDEAIQAGWDSLMDSIGLPGMMPPVSGSAPRS